MRRLSWVSFTGFLLVGWGAAAVAFVDETARLDPGAGEVLSPGGVLLLSRCAETEFAVEHVAAGAARLG